MFSLIVKNDDAYDCQLRQFSVAEYCLGEDPILDLEVSFVEGINFSSLLGTEITLDVGAIFHAVVQTVKVGALLPSGRQVVQLIAIGHLALLGGNVQSQTFVDQSVSQIIRTLCTPLLGKIWINIDLKNTDFTLKYYCQYLETDRDFLQKLLEEFGITYYYSTEKNNPGVFFTDNIQYTPIAKKTEALVVAETTGAPSQPDRLYDLKVHYQLLPSQISLTGQDPCRFPLEEVKVCQHSRIPGNGKIALFMGADQNQERLHQQALLRIRYYDTHRERFTATLYDQCLLPGQSVSIINEEGRAEKLLVTQIAFSGDENFNRGSNEKSHFTEMVTLIPFGVPYIGSIPLDLKPIDQDPIVSAEVESHDNSPYLNNRGAYKVKMDFDTKPTPKTEGSHFVPQLTPSASPHSGWHSPLYPDSKVMLAHLNQDINQPIILGALWKENVPKGEGNHPNAFYTWRTEEGAALTFDETTSQPEVHLTTPKQAQYLNLGKEGQVVLANNKGDLKIATKGQLEQITSLDWIAKCGGHSEFHVSQNFLLTSTHGSIALKANQDITLNAKANYTISCTNMHWNVANQFSLKASSVQWISKEGDFTLKLNNGSYQIQAKSSVIIQSHQGDIILKTPKSHIILTSSGQITLKATTLKIQADELITQGTNSLQYL